MEGAGIMKVSIELNIIDCRSCPFHYEVGHNSMSGPTSLCDIDDYTSLDLGNPNYEGKGIPEDCPLKSRKKSREVEG